jgi:hypothetical protein
VHIGHSLGVAGARAADFDEDSAHDAGLIIRSKQAIPKPSRRRFTFG